MAGNLLKSGYSLVIHDLRREQGKALEDRGAVFKESPKAVAESCEMVLSMLPYNEAVHSVGLGKGGLHEVSQMPDNIEKVFEGASARLFPSKVEFKSHCTCPDSANPCKHIAAVCYIIAEEFDRNPFMILSAAEAEAAAIF